MAAAADPAELERLRAAVDADQPSFAAQRDYLRQVRQLRLRDVERVVRCGADLLSRHARKLDADELWELHEQVAVAAMEAGCKELALRLVGNVHGKFPSSARASRLTGVCFESSPGQLEQGMYFESLGSFEEAEQLYAKELENDPNNSIILKRLVGLKRGRGDLAGAAEALQQYLATQGATDWVAWEEAADLYLQLQMYQQAAYCLEELLLHQPADAGRHLQYADTLYTLGGAHNWRTARAYYSGVIEMTKGQNLRALYGACACAAQLAGARRGGGGGSGGGGAADAEGEQLGKLAAEALVQQYAVHCPAKLPLVRSMLRAQGLA